MSVDTGTRNSFVEMAASVGGVGARHSETGPAGGRGGYLEICIGEKFSKKIAPRADARLAELREIGLAAHWLEIAETIGVDNFLAMWAILSDSDAVQSEKHYAYVTRYSVWSRYQRNRVIMALHADGLPADDIRRRIKTDLGEHISAGHIKRIIEKGWSAPADILLQPTARSDSITT